MSNDELQDLLRRLKAEIAQLGPADEEARVRLESLVSDVERRIGAAEEPGADEDLMQGLRETVERFEIEHPRATGILNDIMVMLGSMGI